MWEKKNFNNAYHFYTFSILISIGISQYNGKVFTMFFQDPPSNSFFLCWKHFFDIFTYGWIKKKYLKQVIEYYQPMEVARGRRLRRLIRPAPKPMAGGPKKCCAWEPRNNTERMAVRWRRVIVLLLGLFSVSASLGLERLRYKNILYSVISLMSYESQRKNVPKNTKYAMNLINYKTCQGEFST